MVCLQLMMLWGQSATMKPHRLIRPAEVGIDRQYTQQAGETADQSWALHRTGADLLYAAGMRGATMPLQLGGWQVPLQLPGRAARKA